MNDQVVSHQVGNYTRKQICALSVRPFSLGSVICAGGSHFLKTPYLGFPRQCTSPSRDPRGNSGDSVKLNDAVSKPKLLDTVVSLCQSTEQSWKESLSILATCILVCEEVFSVYSQKHYSVSRY